MDDVLKSLLNQGFERCHRHIIMYPDLNAQGRLFGGRLLEWIDIAVAGFVFDRTGTRDIVTVRFGEVIFEAPGEVNDVAEIWCRLMRIGGSSIQVEARVMVDPGADKRRHLICRSDVTFVHIGSDGRSRPWTEKMRQRALEVRS
jgi:acyl-CoA hydrolase